MTKVDKGEGGGVKKCQILVDVNKVRSLSSEVLMMVRLSMGSIYDMSCDVGNGDSCKRSPSLIPTCAAWILCHYSQLIGPGVSITDWVWNWDRDLPYSNKMSKSPKSKSSSTFEPGSGVREEHG